MPAAPPSVRPRAAITFSVRKNVVLSPGSLPRGRLGGLQKAGRDFRARHAQYNAIHGQRFRHYHVARIVALRAPVSPCVWFVVQCCAFFLVRQREHAMRTARRAVRAKAAALHAGCQRRGAEHLQCHGARRARLDAGSAQRGVRDALPGGRPPCAPLRTAYRCRTITQIRNQNKILYTR